MNRTEPELSELNRTELEVSEQNRIELEVSELNRTELDFSDLNRNERELNQLNAADICSTWQLDSTQVRAQTVRKSYVTRYSTTLLITCGDYMVYHKTHYIIKHCTKHCA